MKPLTLETLQELVATTRAVVEFPKRDLAITVRELTAAEFQRVHKAVGAADENDEEAEKRTRVLLCSMGICDANYDTDEGRERLAKMPSRVLQKLSDKIMELAAIDIGGIPKNLLGETDLPSGSASPSELSTPTT